MSAIDNENRRMKKKRIKVKKKYMSIACYKSTADMINYNRILLSSSMNLSI
jgi:cephalosporin hydroxylase